MDCTLPSPVHHVQIPRRVKDKLEGEKARIQIIMQMCLLITFFHCFGYLFRFCKKLSPHLPHLIWDSLFRHNMRSLYASIRVSWRGFLPIQCGLIFPNRNLYPPPKERHRKLAKLHEFPSTKKPKSLRCHASLYPRPIRYTYVAGSCLGVVL